MVKPLAVRSLCVCGLLEPILCAYDDMSRDLRDYEEG